MNPSTKILVTFVLALALVLAGTRATLAAVWTGRADYEPGSLVTIYGDNSDGAGYLAGEPVFVEVWGPNGFHLSSEPNNPTVDANGVWSWQFTLWNSEDAVGEYRYIATGRTSNVSQSGTFTDAWWWQILDSSIGPSTGGCDPTTITVRATLQTKATSSAPWAPAVGKYLTFGFKSADGTTLNSVPSSPTNASGQATASIVPPKVAAMLWAQYNAPAQDPIYTSIAFNTPTLTFAVSDATYDGGPHGASATLTNLCGDQAPPLVGYIGLDHSYQGGLAPIDAGSYMVAAQYSWGAVFGSDLKYFTIARAKAFVTPDSSTRQYSDQNPTLTGALSGFLERDGVTASYNTPATSKSAPGSYPIVATLSAPTVPDGPRGLNNYDVTRNTGVLQVVKEDAYIGFDPTNPEALQASTPGGSLNAGALTLKVNVQELPDQPAATAAAGEIDLAGLTVTLAPSPDGATIALKCSAPAAGSGYAIKTFTCTNDAAIPVGVYEVIASVTGSSYMSVEYHHVLTIEDPISGFATGGGWFYWPGTGDKTNFGFTTKYNKSNANLKGSLLVIRHHQDGTISRIKSSALEDLKLRNAGGCTIATFSGKATVKAWDAALGAYVNSGGNAFSVSAEDCNNPGSGVDSFWISSIGNLAFPAPASSNQVQIGGGNIVVPHTANE